MRTGGETGVKGSVSTVLVNIFVTFKIDLFIKLRELYSCASDSTSLNTMVPAVIIVLCTSTFRVPLSSLA